MKKGNFNKIFIFVLLSIRVIVYVLVSLSSPAWSLLTDVIVNWTSSRSFNIVIVAFYGFLFLHVALDSYPHCWIGFWIQLKFVLCTFCVIFFSLLILLNSRRRKKYLRKRFCFLFLHFVKVCYYYVSLFNCSEWEWPISFRENKLWTAMQGNGTRLKMHTHTLFTQSTYTHTHTHNIWINVLLFCDFSFFRSFVAIDFFFSELLMTSSCLIFQKKKEEKR